MHSENVALSEANLKLRDKLDKLKSKFISDANIDKLTKGVNEQNLVQLQKQIVALKEKNQTLSYKMAKERLRVNQEHENTNSEIGKLRATLVEKENELKLF